MLTHAHPQLPKSRKGRTTSTTIWFVRTSAKIKEAFYSSLTSALSTLRHASHYQTPLSRSGIVMLLDNTRMWYLRVTSPILVHLSSVVICSGFSTSATSVGGGSSMSMGGGSSMSMGGNSSTSMSGSSLAPSGGGGDGMGGMSATMTDSYNFLRGGWPTNENGIVTFNTIFPGYCKRHFNPIKDDTYSIHKIPAEPSTFIPWYTKTLHTIPTGHTLLAVDRLSILSVHRNPPVRSGSLKYHLRVKCSSKKILLTKLWVSPHTTGPR